ncbi:MAG: ribbon-helix-helix domain-containing protein [Bacteroidales bacterium]|nr:ribbon-helix-helix domain-containing protein [Bacteroidales bacterium]MCM1414622.1 ribbon-helix-helix domain-containing protein [bacterium]MCM1423887.1 ribbon-helix-helix domain-containing protein [bacterium]
MGKYKNKSYSLRIDDELMKKVKMIAESEDRPVSKQLERIIKQYVEQYEEEHGRLNSAELSITKTG